MENGQQNEIYAFEDALGGDFCGLLGAVFGKTPDITFRKRCER